MLKKNYYAVASCAALHVAFAPYSQAGIGEDTAQQISTLYSSTVSNCGENRPAYLCSGLMLRGTTHSENFKVWNPSPTSITNGGVSFSYIRKDAKYDRLGLLKYNGYILKPADNVSTSEMKLSTLCFFPIDAWTDNRTDNGCGDNRDTNDVVEGSCTTIGINTADQWLDHFRSFPSSKENLTARNRICSYDIRSELGAVAVTNFNTSLGAMAKLGNISFHRQNEIRIATWAQDKQDTLPIMAFIYTKKSGLESAKLDQRDLYNSTTNKRWVPIIYANLPITNAKDATFTYSAEDQMIAPPAPTGSVASPSSTPTSTCSRYVEKAEWQTAWIREIKLNKPQLSITPTDCARMMGDEELPKFMSELATYRNSDWLAARDLSVKAQVRCLRGMYPANATWNVEPFRPALNDELTNNARCNPYGVPDQLTDASPKPAADETPESILARIMKNYGSIRTASTPCVEDGTKSQRGHYYCSGVILRTVKGNNYKPWDFTSFPTKKDFLSYSWIRKDIPAKRLYWPAGFILRSPADAVVLNRAPLDIGWRCIYAYDPGTTEHSSWGGCGPYQRYRSSLEEGYKRPVLNNRNNADAFGYCDIRNIKSATAWLGLYSVDRKRRQQCSWNPEIASNWDTIVQLQNKRVHTHYPWNEFILKRSLPAAQGGYNVLSHIDAFFYDVNRPSSENGLRDARSYQCKAKVEAGKIIPILRLNFKAAAAMRFIYEERDQATSCT